MEQPKSKNKKNGSPDLQWLWDRSLDIESQWNADDGYERFRKRVKPARRKSLWKISAAAAAVIIAATVYLWKTEAPATGIQEVRAEKAASGIRLIVDGEEDLMLDEQSKILYSDTSLQITGEALGTGQDAGDMGRRSVAVPIPQTSLATLVVPAGKVFSAELPDGTKVWLNAGSSLKYPLKFAGGERRVELDGEACFDVTKDQDKPFIVETSGGMQTKVVGTKFNISSYSDSPCVITMVTGVVEVNITGEKHNLCASQQMVYNKGNATLRKVDPSPYVSWTSGRLGFDGDTLEQMCSKMMRWYDVNIEIDGDGLDSVRFSGYIPRDMAITEALDLLYKSENIKYRYDGFCYRLYR